MTPANPSTIQNGETARAEVLRLWTSSYSDNGEIAAADRTYIARLVAMQTGLSQPEFLSYSTLAGIFVTDINGCATWSSNSPAFFSSPSDIVRS